MYAKIVLVVIAVFESILAAPTVSEETSAESNQRIAKECFHKHSLTVEILREFRLNPDDPPKPMLCYMKCFLEHKGLIDEKGQINTDYGSGSEDDSDEDSSSSEEYVSIGQGDGEDLSCLKHLDPIKTCSDMKHVLKCLPTIRYHDD